MDELGKGLFTGFRILIIEKQLQDEILKVKFKTQDEPVVAAITKRHFEEQ